MTANAQSEPEPIELGTSEVHVWPVSLGMSSDGFKPPIEALSDDERERARHFHNDQARERFSVTRAALRAILGRYLSCSPVDVRFEEGASGKPRLVGQQRASANHGIPLDLQFNVAHSGGLALIGVALGCQVGVDVEQLRTVRHCEQIARRYFHPAEVMRLMSVSTAKRDATFLRCWTCKEAVLKAVGVGITAALDTFRVAFEAPPGVQVKTEIPGGSECWLETLALERGYVGAIACIGTPRRVHWMSLENEILPTQGNE